MTDKLKQYLEFVFSPYEKLSAVKELKEELYCDLKEKMSDLRNDGYDDEAAYKITIDSIGEISEIVESINAKSRELQQMVGINFCSSNLNNSDLSSIKAQNGKFNYSNLQSSDFSYSDLSSSSFKCSNLNNVNFSHSNLTEAKIIKCDLKGSSFEGSTLDNVDFGGSNLSGVSFDNQKFNGTVFDYAGLRNTSFRNAVFNNVSFKTDVKKAIFDGAFMDKITYALLKGYKAKLDNVTII